MTIEDLTDGILERAGNRKRYLFALAGPPGAGKSTLAEIIRAELTAKGHRSKIVPMDGFHLDNSVLTTRDLLAKKGAPQTFDALAFIQMVQDIRNGAPEVSVPTFDRHADKVIPGGDRIDPEDRILIFEGNYLLLNQEPWQVLLPLWDETAFINPGIDELERRLIGRWIEHGLDEEAATAKALGSDIPNARLVVEHSFTADQNL